MDSPTQALWDAIHRGSALLRPVPVVGARRHSIHHPGDDEEVAPSSDLEPGNFAAREQYVYYSHRRQHWYVQIRDWRFPVKTLHSKTGFKTQDEAIAYRDFKLAEWGNPVPPNRR